MLLPQDTTPHTLQRGEQLPPSLPTQPDSSTAKLLQARQEEQGWVEAQGGHPGQALTCRAQVLQVCSTQGAGSLHAQRGWQHKELHDGIAERVTQGPAQLLRQLQQADVALLPDVQAHQHARLCGERVVLHGSSTLPSEVPQGMRRLQAIGSCWPTAHLKAGGQSLAGAC